MSARLDFTEAPRCCVGLSALHGEGLFARDSFHAGELVADYHHNAEQWERCRYSELQDRTDIHAMSWFIGEDMDTIRIGSSNSVFMRANHSRSPNTVWDPVARTLVALCDIEAGEEITYDYRLEIAPPWLKENPPAWA